MVNQVILAKTKDMILLDGGEPKTIGGIYANMDLEFDDGTIVKTNCVFFNLDSKIDSTDFFLFHGESNKLVSYSIGIRTDPLFEKMYLKTLSLPSNHHLKPFLSEFVSEYVIQGLMGYPR
jgi:hypothetical protein